MGLEVNEFIATALIYTYSKCETVKDAKNEFHIVRFKNIVTYNAMIGCYRKNDMIESLIKFFGRLDKEDIYQMR